MRHSDIFDRFVKVAQEKGIVSSKDLYEVKPKSSDDMSYKNNIMEIAHPNSLVIAPAYDKINGLVENNIERQNILLHIVNKETNGLLTQHKYASDNLILSLVRVANDLDNRDQDELRSLADTCLMQLKKEAEGVSSALLGVGVVLAAVTALYVQQHMDAVDQGYNINYQNLSKEIDDLIESSNTFGTGYELSDTFKEQMEDFKTRLEDFDEVYNKFVPLIEKLDQPRTQQERKDFLQEFDAREFVEAYNELREAVDEMDPYLDDIESYFKDPGYKSRQITEKGMGIELLDKLKMHGGVGLISDHFDDVAHMIPAYKESIKSIVNLLKNAERKRVRARNKISRSRRSQSTPYSSQEAESSPIMSESPRRRSLESALESEDAEGSLE
jgi:hypothetical protein